MIIKTVQVSEGCVQLLFFNLSVSNLIFNSYLN